MKHVTKSALAGSVALPRAIVAVRADAADPKKLFDGLMSAVAELRAEHAAEIASLKKDVVQSEKVEKINSAISVIETEIDKLNKSIAAAMLNAGPKDGPKDQEYTNSFLAYARRGDVQAALNKGAAEDGGYLAPVEWNRTINQQLVEIDPIRALASVISIANAGFSELYDMGGTTSGWVKETDPRPETAGPKFKSQEFGTFEVYANPSATQQILDDAEINLESYLAGKVQEEFAVQEGKAFVSGSGNGKPRGLLTYTAAADHPYGAIEEILSGTAAGITADKLIELVYSLHGIYLQNARFICNRRTLAKVRLLKDGNDNYLWQPSYQVGEPSTLLGHPVTDVPSMPDIAANAVPIMFGDFKKGYRVIDRTGIRMLRDPFTNKPYISFYTTKRVGGGVNDPRALRYCRVGV